MEIQGELVETSWKNAIKRVLAESPTMTMHYTEISEQILSRGYYETEGATPAATVNAQLGHSLKADGEKTPFMRVGRGIWALKVTPDAPELAQATKAKKVVAKTETLSEIDVESSESIIHSFGMYWQRDQVVWRSDPVMIGKEQALSKPIDFGKQKGIYILYDHHTAPKRQPSPVPPPNKNRLGHDCWQT